MRGKIPQVVGNFPLIIMMFCKSVNQHYFIPFWEAVFAGVPFTPGYLTD